MRFRGFLKLIWTELKLFARDPFAAVFALAFPLTMMLLLGAAFGDTPTTDRENGELVFRGLEATDYYMTGSIAMVIGALGLLSLPIHLAGYREQGVLRRYQASSIPAWAMFGAQVVVSLVVAAVGSALMVAINAVVNGTRRPADLAGVITVFLLGTLCFTALGFLLAALIRTARAAQGLGLMLFFMAWLFSGGGPPRAVLPDAIRTISEGIPLTHVLIGLQDAWFGLGWPSSELLILGGVAIVAAVPAVILFRWD